MKHFIIIWFIIHTTIVTAWSQAVRYRSGSVEYAVSYDFLMQQPLLSESLPKVARVSFGKGKIRSEKLGTKTENFKVANYKNNTSYTAIQFFGTGYWVKEPSTTIDKVVLTDSFKTILGYPCRRALVTKEDGIEVEVFYTTALGAQFSPYRGIEGFALEYSTATFGDLTLYKATKITPEKLSKKLFEQPSTHQAISREAFDALKKEFMTPVKPLKPGQQAPPIRQNDHEGILYELSDKPTLLAFWFSANQNCVMDIPTLNELYGKHQNDPIDFIAVSMDSPDILERFLKKYPYKFRHLPNATALRKQYGVSEFPTYILLKNKKIWYFKVGSEALFDDLDAALTEIQRE
jgi:GLPGLI family protein